MEKILKISGVPVTELAKQYGTPLYVYDEKTSKLSLAGYQLI